MPITSTSSYRPNGGGDFTDVVELGDGTVRALIGDVMGHGPDEAELGERLRKVWHSAVVSDVPDGQILPLMHGVVAESARDAGPLGRFATVCELVVAGANSDAGGGATAVVRSAGHPPPLLIDTAPTRYSDLRVGPPLGVPTIGTDELWQPLAIQLAPNSCLVLYTDGLLDAYATEVSLGFDELAQAAGSWRPDQDVDSGAWLSRLLNSAPRQPTDDTAVVVLAIP